MSAGADPGFPIGGGANPRGEGRQHTNLPDFPKNYIKIKKILVRGGTHTGSTPLLDPPLVGAPLDGRRPPLYRIPDLPLEYLFYTRF